MPRAKLPTDSEEEYPRDTAVNLMLWVTFGILAVQVILMIATQVILYGDGAGYFYWLLRYRGPLTFALHRSFALFVTEVPVVTALRAGVTDVGILSRLFGAGLYLPLILSLGLCLWIARERVHLMLFPLLSATAVTSNTDFLVLNESNVLVALFWPLLFLLTLTREWSGRTIALVILLAVPTLLCYESMVFIGPLLLGLAVTHGAEMRRAGDTTRARLFFGLAFYFAMGMAIAAWRIIQPWDKKNFQSFLAATRFYRDAYGHLHWLGILSFVALALVAAALLLRRWPAVVGWTLAAAFTVACAFAAVAPAVWPGSFAPKLHVQARVLNAYLAPLLGVAFLLGWRRPFQRVRLRYAFAIVTILAAAQGTWHALATRRWVDYLNTFRAEVATRRGLVPFETSAMSREPLSLITTSWAMPTMSVWMAPAGRVQAMIESPLPNEWQPLYPEKIDKLPDLRRYGITFDAYVAAMK